MTVSKEQWDELKRKEYEGMCKRMGEEEVDRLYKIYLENKDSIKASQRLEKLKNQLDLGYNTDIDDGEEYIKWYGDNIQELRKGFIQQHKDEFDQYCDEEYEKSRKEE